MKFHLGGATLFWNKTIVAGYNICTLLLSVTVVSISVDILYVELSWKVQCMTLCCFEFLLYWLAPSVTNLWHKYKKNIWKICDISIVIDLSILVKKRCLLSQEIISFCIVMSVCVCVWGRILMCDQPATFGIWMHAVGCICSSVWYWCDANSWFLQNIGSTTTWCHTPVNHNICTWCCESIRSHRAYGLRCLHLIDV
jgi:hypothetical protein